MGTFIIRPTVHVSGGLPYIDSGAIPGDYGGWASVAAPGYTILQCMLDEINVQSLLALAISDTIPVGFSDTLRFSFTGSSIYLDGSLVPISSASLPTGFVARTALVRIDIDNVQQDDATAEYFLQKSSGDNGFSNLPFFAYDFISPAPTILDILSNGCGLKVELLAATPTVSVAGINIINNLRIEGTYEVPHIDSVSLSHGAPFGDSLVNITGSGFVDGGTITNIYFGSTPATNIYVLNDENVSCHTPAHALGSVFITIEFDSGPDIVSDVALFTYIEESFTLEVESEDPEEGETEPVEWVEPVEVGDEITISSEDEENPLDLTEILTLELLPVDGGTPISITITSQEFFFLIFDIPAADPGIYAIVGTTFSGSVILGTLQVLLVGNASGVYTLVPGKTNDTIYNNARDGTTQDVRIPIPKIRTGFVGQ